MPHMHEFCEVWRLDRQKTAIPEPGDQSRNARGAAFFGRRRIERTGKDIIRAGKGRVDLIRPVTGFVGSPVRKLESRSALAPSRQPGDVDQLLCQHRLADLVREAAGALGFGQAMDGAIEIVRVPARREIILAAPAIALAGAVLRLGKADGALQGDAQQPGQRSAALAQRAISCSVPRTLPRARPSPP